MRRWTPPALLFVLLTLAGRPSAADNCTSAGPLALQRFFSVDATGPIAYRALRHLEARNEQWDKTASMDVWTEADQAGFRYDVIAESGSGYIRSRVFEPVLTTEQQMWATRASDRATISPQNYTFKECGPPGPEGLARVDVKPRRKDLLLVEGSIFLRPEDGELVRVQGLLSKAPSFWTRRVEIIRVYERIGGVRMPVAFETVANILLAGKSTFKMTYSYETVNGQTVGRPELPSR
jgi:hypothetical protein